MSHRRTPPYSFPAPIVGIALTALLCLVAYNTPQVLYYEMGAAYYMGSFVLLFASRLWVRHREKMAQDVVDALLATVQYLTILSVFWLPILFSIEDYLAGLTYGDRRLGVLDNSLIENALLLALMIVCGGFILFVVNLARALRKSPHRDPFDDPDLTIEDLGWMIQQSTYSDESRLRGMRRLAEAGLEGAPHVLRADLEHDEVVEQLLTHLLHGQNKPEDIEKMNQMLNTSTGWMSRPKLALLIQVWKTSPLQTQLLPVLAAQDKLYMDRSWSEELLRVAHAHDLAGAHMAAVTQVLQLTGEHSEALDYLERHGVPEALPGLKESHEKLSLTPGKKARIREVIDTIQRRHGVEFGSLTLAEAEPEKQGALSEVAAVVEEEKG